MQAAKAGREAELARQQAGMLVDADARERAIALLNDHYARGAFDMAELQRRHAIALSAKTRGDLWSVTGDLAPTAPPTSVASLVPPSVTKVLRNVLYAVLAVFVAMSAV